MARTPHKIGLTGGIACGKSTAAQAFEALGVTVIDADQVARDVVAPGTPGQAALAEAIGAEFFDASGKLDRSRLRAAMFRDPALRQRVETVLHPLIRQQLFSAADRAPGPYVVLAVPLLIEGGLDREMDRVVVVDCPPEEQRKRLRNRDGETDAQIDRILATQTNRQIRLARADFVLHNDGTTTELHRQVEALDSRLRQLP